MNRITSELGQVQMDATKKFFEMMKECAGIGSMIDFVECGSDSDHWYDVCYNQYECGGEYEVFEHEGNHESYRSCLTVDELIYALQKPAMTSVVLRYLEAHYRIDRKCALESQLDGIVQAIADVVFDEHADRDSDEWNFVQSVVLREYEEANN